VFFDKFCTKPEVKNGPDVIVDEKITTTYPKPAVEEREDNVLFAIWNMSS